jgi:hypothetical protein
MTFVDHDEIEKLNRDYWIVADGHRLLEKSF